MAKAYFQKDAEVAAQAGLPVLQGTEKQIAWAETIRLDRLDKLRAVEEAVEKARATHDKVPSGAIDVMSEAIAALKSQDSAHWWIEHRSADLFTNTRDFQVWLLGGSQYAKLSPAEQVARARHHFGGLAKPSAAVETAPAEVVADAKAEATVRPESPRTETIAEITIDGTALKVHFPEKREDFRQLIRFELGFTWADTHWRRTLTAMSGSPADRAAESLNRFRTIKNEAKTTWQGLPWTTLVTPSVYNAYPIYDWRTEDVWIAHGRQGWDYNRIYDLMNLAGLTIHQMRLCQPYGDDQRKGLWLFKILEPETWAKVVNRVQGANFGNRYVELSGNVMGNLRIALPQGHTWKSYAKFLLATMPPATAEHYRGKILVFLKWWRKHGKEHGFPRIPDQADARLEAARKAPSWRRICKVLLKNDYWCKGLSFSQTKREMERQLALVAKYMEEL
jgi:hypothetical protein